MAASVKLSQLVRSQLPSHVQENHETFARFLELYYEWLEQQSNPVDVIRNWDDYNAATSSVDEFVEEIKNETLHSVPSQIVADKRRLALHAREFYRSKGTEKSFKFLFRVLFNEEIEMYYPKQNLFRLSEGTWNANDTVIVTSAINEPSEYLYKKIRQTRIITEENVEEASAIVTRAQRVYKNNVISTVFHLGDIKGTFKSTHHIYIDQDESKREYFYPIVSDIKVTSGGSGYQKGDLVQISNSGDWVVEKNVPSSKIVDTGVTTLIPKSDLSVSLNGTPTTNFTYDGRNVTLPDAIYGDVASVLFPKSSGYAVVNSVSESGAITEVKMYEFPTGHLTSPAYTIQSRTGSGASLSIEVGIQGYRPGYYSDETGFLSAYSYLHDSDYYQDFSYVIRASRSIDTYAGFVKKLLHPAGMKMFGEIYVLSVLSMVIKKITTYHDTEPRTLDLSSEAGPLGQMVSDLDWIKLSLDVPVSSYGDLTLGNITQHYGKRWNFGFPTDITIEPAP